MKASIRQSSAERRLQQMIKRLKESDCRITPQRYAVLHVLAENPDHPSAESIHAELIEHHPTMSLATVYKTIHLLKCQGEVLELGFSDFGNRYDGRKPYPHPHVICTECGKISDHEQLNLDEIIRRTMEATGFKIVTNRLDFYGICPECRK